MDRIARNAEEGRRSRSDVDNDVVAVADRFVRRGLAIAVLALGRRPSPIIHVEQRPGWNGNPDATTRY